MKKTANTGSTAVELEKELGMSEEELFSFAEYHPEEAERTGYSEYSYWKSVFRSFRKNKAAGPVKIYAQIYLQAPAE